MSVSDTLRAIGLALAVSSPALSQPLAPPPPPETVSLSGPRFGATVLSNGVVDKLRTEDGIELRPMVTQFGWQFEKQFYSPTQGTTALTEWVVLLGGLEQSVALPSISWLVGLRTHGGAEFAIGPNVTPVGIALALAAGTTIRWGVMNVPVNVAVVPSKSGVRVSVLSGFSLRR
jgi:hypothetical protein